MRALESRNDPFETTQQLESFKRFVVRDGDVCRTTDVFEMCVLRPHAWIVQPCRDRVRRMHLSRGVLDQIAQRTVQTAGRPVGAGRGAMLRVQSLRSRLYSDEFDPGIANNRVEGADGSAASTHARH